MVAVNYGVEGEHYTLTEDGLINPYEVQADGTLVSKGTSWQPLFGDAGPGYLVGIADYENGVILDPSGTKVVVEAPLAENASEVDLKKRHIDQVRAEALSLWASFEAVNRIPDFNYTVEEKEARSDVYGDIETFVYEGVTQFIMGQRELDTFDAFVAEIEAMGLADALAIAQAKLDAQ